jgi:hypothetical protein
VGDDAETERTDFLFGLVWATVPEMAAAGYADQHHRDARVVQTLAAALLATRRTGRGTRCERRLAAVWRGFAGDLTRLCRAWGVGEAVAAQYLDVPFAEVRPAIERLMDRKAAAPDLGRASRRLRDRTLALTELVLAVERLNAGRGAQWLRIAGVDRMAEDVPLRRGPRRVRQMIRAGARVALMSRESDTILVWVDTSPLERAGEIR